MEPLITSATSNAPGAILDLAYRLQSIDKSSSGIIGKVNSIAPMLSYSQYVDDLTKYNGEASSWNSKMKGRKEAIEEREKNAKEAFPKPIKDLTKTLEACPDKPVPPKAQANFDFGNVL